jgi:predicted nucleotidyltransferase
MSPLIDLDFKYLDLIAAIFCKHLPSETKIYFFGSRVTGRAKPYSDIDLLIDTGTSLTLERLTLLNTAFDESLLPYKVDIVDASTMSDAFRLAIQDQLVPFNYHH